MSIACMIVAIITQMLTMARVDGAETVASLDVGLTFRSVARGRPPARQSERNVTGSLANDKQAYNMPDAPAARLGETSQGRKRPARDGAAPRVTRPGNHVASATSRIKRTRLSRHHGFKAENENQATLTARSMQGFVSTLTRETV